MYNKRKKRKRRRRRRRGLGKYIEHYLTCTETISLSDVNISEIPTVTWLEGWSYRKYHKIVGSTGGWETDYQVRIIVHYGSGTDSGEHVYLNGKCRTDFGDIRFTKDDGVTKLQYWIEEKVDGDYAIVWVKIPFMPQYPAYVIIYIYYGNPSATSESDPNTMIAYVGFESGGFELFVNELVGNFALEVIPEAKRLGNYGAHGYNPDGLTSAGRWSNEGTFWKYNKVAIEFWMKADITSDSYYVSVYFTKEGKLCLIVSMWGYSPTPYQFGYYNGAWGYFGAWTPNTWYKFVVELDYDNQIANIHVYDENRNLLYEVTNIALGTESTTFTDVMMYIEMFTIGHGYWDEFFSRKWLSPEPTHDVWGSEESAVVGYVQTLTESLSLSDAISVSRGVMRVLSELISLSDVLVTRRALTRSLVETITLSDVLSLIKSLTRILTETVTLTDVLVTGKRLTKSLSESITLTDVVIASKRLARILEEAIVLTDSVQLQKILARTLAEILTLIDTLIVSPPPLKTLRLVKDLIDVFIESDHNDNVNNFKQQLQFLRRLSRTYTEISSKVDELETIISKMRYVKYDERYTHNDHNVLVDAFKKLLEIDKQLVTLIPSISSKVSELEEIVSQMKYLKRRDLYYASYHNLFREAWEKQREINSLIT